ncbi:MAG TPA: hypothetical protein VFP00_09550 [Burkholderiales bacterium]|nr:hypothetical protein [Burkholderiales bacterium]
MSDVDAHDAAWVAIDVPLTAPRLAEFCLDVERLYRINPYLEFRAWRATAGGACVAYKNLSNGRNYEACLTVVRASYGEFCVRYDRGIKSETRFRIEPQSDGSRLTIKDNYSGAGQNPDLAEVDRSLHAWGVALREYLQREARWGHIAPWRWYMRRVWVPMKPSARRITYIILIITLAEIALMGLVMAVYWAERSG